LLSFGSKTREVKALIVLAFFVLVLSEAVLVLVIDPRLIPR
jgi:hypothetical protein